MCDLQFHIPGRERLAPDLSPLTDGYSVPYNLGLTSEPLIGNIPADRWATSFLTVVRLNPSNVPLSPCRVYAAAFGYWTERVLLFARAARGSH